MDVNTYNTILQRSVHHPPPREQLADPLEGSVGRISLNRWEQLNAYSHKAMKVVDNGMDFL